MADQIVMKCNVRLNWCISVKLINHLSIQKNYDLLCFSLQNKLLSEKDCLIVMCKIYNAVMCKYIDIFTHYICWQGFRLGVLQCFNGTRPLFSALIGPLCPN